MLRNNPTLRGDKLLISKVPIATSSSNTMTVSKPAVAQMYGLTPLHVWRMLKDKLLISKVPIAKRSTRTMAVSCNLTSLHRYSPLFSPPLQISDFSVQIPNSTSFQKKNNWSQLVVASSRSSVRKTRERANGDAEFCVVTFYKFVSIEDPQREVAKHQEFLQGRDIHGRIYVNEQGINAQYSGPVEDALAYADWLKEDSRFSDILVQTSPALDGHAFPRLKMRYKPSLVQLEGGMSHLPVLNPSMRATLLTPAEWRERLQASANAFELPNKASGSNHERRSLLLDVRNGYEWDVGHFQGAERPEVDCFRHTSVGLSSDETAGLYMLAGVDAENTDILMYCTGGIRCDVYSTILRQRGFQNLYALSGGISHYLKSVGSIGWVGNLFVFDSRLSLPPSPYNSSLTTDVRSKIVSEKERFARCYICRSQVLELRHRNCANLDCNRLFLSCGSCVAEFRGCCCSDCTEAHRLRPVLPGYKRYQKWHLYRDGVF